MRTARLTTLIAPLLLTATAAVTAVEGSVVGGAVTTGTEVRASATDDTPWPRLSSRPAAVASDGDTPWPRLSPRAVAVASDGDTPWPRLSSRAVAVASDGDTPWPAGGGQ